MKHVLILALLLPFAAAYAQISGPGSTTTSPGVITTDQAHTPNYLVTSISFTHNILALPNPILVVGCSKNTWPRTFVTGVTVNGVPAVKMAQLKGLALNRPTDTSSWIMTRLSPGVVTINVSSTGGATSGYGVSCIAQDYYGVNQSSPVELVDTDDLPPNIVSVTCNFAPLQDGDWLVIFEYSTAYNQSSPMTAIPFAPDIVSGRYYALQMGMAHAGPLFSGRQYSETWTEHNSHTSVEWSLIGLVLRPA